MTREKGRQTRHSFSFGEFYDPDRVAFGPLIALNDDLLGTGTGYDAHEHADVVLVTWVVTGQLTHVDDSGATVQPAGELSVTDAGTGMTHSERAVDGATRFIQMWLRPGQPGTAPTRTTTVPQLSGSLTAVAGGDGIPLNVAGATLWLANVAAGASLDLPEGPQVYVFVVTGALTRNSLAEPLAAGDAFEIRQPASGVVEPGADTRPPPVVEPGADTRPLPVVEPGADTRPPSVVEPGAERRPSRDPYSVTAAVPTQLLVWTFEE